ncbi:MAG: RidA family protein [Nitrospinota bacterium]
MNKEIIHTKLAPEAIGPYEQAIKTGGFIFTSGQIAIDPKTNLLIENSIEKQTKRVLENLKAVLEAGGSSLNMVVKTTIYLKDLKTFDVVNTLYSEYFEKSKPARSTIQVAELPKGALIEIDAVALV